MSGTTSIPIGLRTDSVTKKRPLKKTPKSIKVLESDKGTADRFRNKGYLVTPY